MPDEALQRPIPTPDDVVALADAVPSRYRVMVLVAADTGLRLSELTALRRGDVDPDAGVITVRRATRSGSDGPVTGPPKTASDKRSVPVPVSLASTVREHLDAAVESRPDALLFTEADGAPLGIREFRRHWGRAAASLGLAIAFHDLRSGWLIRRAA